MTDNRYGKWIPNYEGSERVFLKEGKGKKLWKKVKYQLIEYHSLPAFLRDNEFILGHYRSEWPMKQVFLSIFTIHNETLNVWTHLMGFFIFLALTVYTVMKVPNVVDLQSLQQFSDVLKSTDLHKIPLELLNCLRAVPNMPDFQKFADGVKSVLPSVGLFSSISNWNILELVNNYLPGRLSYTTLLDDCHNLMQNSVKYAITNGTSHPITRWPFFTFLGGSMFCLFASSACHLLSCHSQRVSYVMLRLDYAGISALISTSFYPPVYYTFLCNPFFMNLYLGLITLFGLATILFSLLPVFQNPEFRPFRALLFFGMGVSGAVPVLHKLILYWNVPEALETAGYEVVMGAFYGLGALIYATRVPERWRPGKFDVVGNSHQLFHVLVVAGAYLHYECGLIYLKWRDMKGC